MPPHAATAAAPMTTTLRLPGISNADAFNRPRKSTSVLSPAGTEMAQRCARALQKRSDNNGCATRLSPQTLLFATQSLARLHKIAEDSQENRLSITSVCQGDLGEIGRSRIPMALSRDVKTCP